MRFLGALVRHSREDHLNNSSSMAIGK